MRSRPLPSFSGIIAEREHRALGFAPRLRRLRHLPLPCPPLLLLWRSHGRQARSRVVIGGAEAPILSTLRNAQGGREPRQRKIYYRTRSRPDCYTKTHTVSCTPRQDGRAHFTPSNRKRYTPTRIVCGMVPQAACGQKLIWHRRGWSPKWPLRLRLRSR